MFSIRAKLIVSILAVATTAVVGMLMIGQWSFGRNFMAYLDSRDAEVLNQLNRALASHYVEHKSWRRFADNRREWRQFTQRHIFSPAQTLQRERKAASSAALSTTWQRPTGAPPADQNMTKIRSLSRANLAHRVSLQDRFGERVIGPPGVGLRSLRQPIMSDAIIVGYLVLQRGHGPLKGIASDFAQRQKTAFVMITLALFAVSLAIAIPLSGQLVRPLRDLLTMTRRLNSGDLKARAISPAGHAGHRDDELAQLVEGFNSLAVTLENNYKARQTWVTDISHELRTPLAFIQGQIEAMLDGVRPLSIESVESLNLQVAQLNLLIDDLYQLSIADAGVVTYQKTALSVLPIVQDAIENCRPLAAKTGVELLLDVERAIDDRCIGDGQRLRQLFDNLLANSVRYTDSPGRAIVRVVNRGEVIVVEISDSAPAVGAEHLPKLFDRLYRVDGSRNRSTGGAGLGLSICKKIVEAHGGQIEALISDLGGLTIRVYLPGLST